MRTFQELFDWAAERKGGVEALEEMLPDVSEPDELRSIPDDRWLSEMTRRVFSAGFSWTVIDKKWDGFENAFEGFEPSRWSEMSDIDLETLVVDKRIVRHRTKILSVQGNAQYILQLADEHGSAGEFFANQDPTKYVELILDMKKRGSRLGGNTGQYFLRSMGVDAAMFTPDVTTALIREEVVAKAVTSKRDLNAAQAAMNHWMEESGRPLGHISRVLAFTVQNEHPYH